MLHGSFTGLREVRVMVEADPDVQRAAFNLVAYGSTEINYAPIMERVLAAIRSNTLAHEAQERDRLQGEMLHD